MAIEADPGNSENGIITLPAKNGKRPAANPLFAAGLHPANELRPSTKLAVADTAVNLLPADGHFPPAELTVVPPVNEPAATADLYDGKDRDGDPFDSEDPLMKIFLKDIGRHPIPTYSQQVDMANRAQQGDAIALEGMIRGNFGLVQELARWYKNRGLDPLDLMQEGVPGLMEAVWEFNPGLGFQFSTFAVWQIRKSMLRAIANSGRTIRLPRHMGERVRYVLSRKEAYPREHHRELNNKEFREALIAEGEYTPKQIDDTFHAIHTATGVRSINAPITPEGNISLGDILPDPGVNVLESVIEKRDRELLTDKLRELFIVPDKYGHTNDRNFQIACLRFGLGPDNGRTAPVAAKLDEIGDHLGLSGERIRQILDKEIIPTLRQNPEFLQLLGVDSRQAALKIAETATSEAKKLPPGPSLELIKTLVNIGHADPELWSSFTDSMRTILDALCVNPASFDEVEEGIKRLAASSSATQLEITQQLILGLTRIWQKVRGRQSIVYRLEDAWASLAKLGYAEDLAKQGRNSKEICHGLDIRAGRETFIKGLERLGIIKLNPVGD